MQKPFTFLLEGGLDQVTPPIAVKPGRLLGVLNHECAERGIRRIDGYERLDGRLKPSDATYHYAPFTSGNQSLVGGTTVTGATSGATGIVVATGTLLSGSYGSSDAVGYLGIYVTAGTFVIGEAIQVSGVTKATLSAAPVERGAADDTIDQTLLRAEIERRRALIQKPAGSGPVRGVWTYGGNIYAFRDNADGTRTVMFRATTSGWSAVTLNERIFYTTGSVAEPDEGAVLTRSGVTSTVERVVVRSGDWSTNNASGYFVISGRAGGNYSPGAATLTGGTTVSLTGSQVQTTLFSGGRFRFRNHTFTGATSDVRMYGVYGTGVAFEYDGSVFAAISTDFGVDLPTHIAVYQNHLVLGFERGALVLSELGWPLSFKPINDAAEINFGSPIRGLLEGAATSLMVYGRNRIGYLIGADTETFEMKDVNTATGAKAETVVMGLKPYHLDDRGVRTLEATADFGDWSMGSVSELVAPLLELKADRGILPSAVLAVKRKNQVRYFFDDGSGISIYLGRKYPEITAFTLPIVVYCACTGEDENGDEVLYVGAEDGHVYQLDTSTSFDGAAVEAWGLLHFVSPGGTAANYRWHTATFEVSGPSDAAITMVADYDYGDPDLQASAATTMSGGGGFWDVSSEWDGQTYWDAPIQGEVYFDPQGIGYNIAVAWSSELTYEQPYTLSSLRLNYSPRGLRRK